MYDINHDWADVHHRLKVMWDALLAAGVNLKFHWAKMHFANRAYAERVYGAHVIERFVSNVMPALKNPYFESVFQT